MTLIGTAFRTRTPPQGVPGIPGPRGLRGPVGPASTVPGPASTVPGPPGVQALLNIIGGSLTVDDLPDPETAEPALEEGDGWIVGSGVDEEPGQLYIYSAGVWVLVATIGSPEVSSVANTVYVSWDTGVDTSSGRNPSIPVKTLERALEIANDAAPTPTFITVQPSANMETAGNLSMPDNCVISCTHRSVRLRPSTGAETNNIFLMGSGCYVEGFSCEGFEIDDLDNPRTGFIAAFRPDAFIARLPYVHKVVAYRGQPPELVSRPMDRRTGNPAIGNGGGVIIADGAVPHPMSPFKQIVLWGATPSSPNGIAYISRNLGFVNAVNAIGIWCHKHFMALSGGQVLLSGCSSQFGDYSLWAEGYGQQLRPAVTAGPLAVDATAAEAVATNAQAIIDAMWLGLEGSGLVATWTEQDETYTRRDAVYFLQAIEYALEGGIQRPCNDFVRGLFKVQEDVGDYALSELVPVFASDKLTAFQLSFDLMAAEIADLVGVSEASANMVQGLVDAINDTLENPVFRRSRSLITAINHQWTLPLSGVTRSAIPERFGGSGRASRIQRSVVQRRGGRVIFSGQDDDGNAVFVGGLTITARTGQLGGRPFDSAVELRAIEAAIALGV